MGLSLTNNISYPKPFKFYDMWLEHCNYSSILKAAWDRGWMKYKLRGAKMRLNAAKGELKKLNKESYSDISGRVKQAEQQMKQAQIAALENPSPLTYAGETQATNHYMELYKAEESFYRQKSRVAWLTLGDSHTSYFHKPAKIRTARKQIRTLTTAVGLVLTDVKDIAEEAVSYYKNLFGKENDEIHPELAHEQLSFDRKLKRSEQDYLCRMVDAAEVKEAIFSMALGKTPGPDGWTVNFYKKKLGYHW